MKCSQCKMFKPYLHSESGQCQSVSWSPKKDDDACENYEKSYDVLKADNERLREELKKVTYEEDEHFSTVIKELEAEVERLKPKADMWDKAHDIIHEISEQHDGFMVVDKWLNGFSGVTLYEAVKTCVNHYNTYNKAALKAGKE